VASGGRLGGNGATGFVEVASGGIIGAGASAGILATGGIDLTTGAIFEAEIGGTAAGIGGYDQVVVDGAVFLDGATLDTVLIAGFAPAFGDAFTIIANDGADPVNGTFAGLAEGAEFVASGRAFSITYKGGDGNDVVLTAIQAVITGTSGNDLVNGTNTIFGQLPATDGDDIISGKGGNDRLFGLAGDDTISGDGGKDKLRGQDGNDTLEGGNGKDNLKGGAGDDILDGGKGKDKLIGGSGADMFLFTTELGGKNVDKIADFKPGEDLVGLDTAIFRKLGPEGPLGAEHFTIGPKAKGKEAQIVYDRKAGTLTYDKNGSKSGGDTLFARIDKKLDLDHGDFLMV
jgi:Ca2+-binding RTX toxin-like protein